MMARKPLGSVYYNGEEGNLMVNGHVNSVDELNEEAREHLHDHWRVSFIHWWAHTHPLNPAQQEDWGYRYAYTIRSDHKPGWSPITEIREVAP